MDLEKKETQDMQKLKLNITRFMPKEPKMMVEARAEKEEMIACHGDSGSPLIVHKTVTVPDTNEKVAVPFVAGNLARIFGAYDQSPESLTCPLPFVSSHSRNGSTNSVVESFCNTATMLDWISSVVGISTEDLADPFYIPPCRNCRKIYRSGNPHGTFKGDGLSYNDMIYEDDNGWHIGVVTDDEFLQDEGDLDSFWIGPIIDSLRINKTSKGNQYITMHIYIYISVAPYYSFHISS
jgi:hypothetical protein